MEKQVRIDETGYKSVFESHDGALGDDLFQRAGRVLAAAKIKAPVRTARLKKSLRRDRQQSTKRNQLTVRVGSTLNYAYMVHEGTRPHVIRPRDGKTLRFVSDGQVTFARVVKHPGTRPNKYLSESLIAAGGVSRVR